MSIEAMTEDELAAIEERDVEFAAGCNGDAMIIAYDRAALLNEVRRLRAQIAASAEMYREDQRRADELASVPG